MEAFETRFAFSPRTSRPPVTRASWVATDPMLCGASWAIAGRLNITTPAIRMRLCLVNGITSRFPSGTKKERALLLQKVGDKLLAVIGQHALRMKLHPFDRQRAMPQRHNHGLPGNTRRDLEFLRQGVLRHDQRMVACAGHRLRDALKDRATIMLDGTRLA